jgi:hypothetical protein
MSTPEVERESPTLPLPPPIDLGDLIETVTRSVARAVDARALNPQPLPPGELVGRHPIIIGIIADPQFFTANRF